MQHLFRQGTPDAVPEPIPANAGHATYPGNVEDIVGDVKGPNLLGEYLLAVEAEHDPATDKTRVGFDYAGRWEA